ncbi:bifunctional adenosylcobinamide kinase/adenosylcobinamide-phosphate guanylyltransferase [Nocardioides alcanivorans]|uniref:bifunctional adenosylcobinamide kinase/adenosylcobinamide-phosphate guanylyltransferase n=1 Tax=Nocardioides alcanivorans TaxID=2897352 RepID=UPI001F34158B|nr:bifunctional adenosylcobinamide kinase/adenosylcobinamide-phosphate guanylyltransferase [Nocardioides alcanivorans]
MTLRLLGTGAADGWPAAFCTCSSCTTERAAGRVRAQSAALLDDSVLLDCAPSTPLAAERLGISLADVSLVLFTHQHSDHFSPATLMYRSWSSAAPLTVAGPPDVVRTAAQWVLPDSGVDFVPVRPGDSFTHGAHRVRVLAADHATGLGVEDEPDAVLFDVSGPSGRVLYATDTGPLPEATVGAVRDAAFDAVVLEESFGDKHDHGTRHLDLTTFPEQVRRLRAVGAVVAGTRVVATHLSHHNPPTPELTRRLADWGVDVLPDGAEVLTGAAAPERRGTLRTLVIGGARSGKSREAERILAGVADVTYVATSYPPGPDVEWQERVARHVAQRPDHWQTLETLDLVGLLQDDGAPLLVDCLTLWLTRVMDRHDAWDDETWEANAQKAVGEEITALVKAWQTTTRRVVAVSNEVGQGVVPDGAGTRRFRDEMGRLNAAIAAVSEDVRLVVAGRVVAL